MNTIAWNTLNDNMSVTGYSKVHYIDGLHDKKTICGKVLPSHHDTDMTNDNGEEMCKMCEKKGGEKSSQPSYYEMQEANDKAEGYGRGLPYPDLYKSYN